MNKKEIISKELDICLEGLGKCSYTLFKDDDSFLCYISEINGVECDVNVTVSYADGFVFIDEPLNDSTEGHFMTYTQDGEIKATDMFYKILLKEMLCSKE